MEADKVLVLVAMVVWLCVASHSVWTGSKQYRHAKDLYNACEGACDIAMRNKQPACVFLRRWEVDLSHCCPIRALTMSPSPRTPDQDRTRTFAFPGRLSGSNTFPRSKEQI